MLKVGDKVIIKSAGEIEEIIHYYNHGPGFAGEMEEFCNKPAKIVKIDDRDQKWFLLDIDHRTWVWDSKWLEKYSVIKVDDDLFEL